MHLERGGDMGKLWKLWKLRWGWILLCWGWLVCSGHVTGAPGGGMRGGELTFAATGKNPAALRLAQAAVAALGPVLGGVRLEAVSLPGISELAERMRSGGPVVAVVTSEEARELSRREGSKESLRFRVVAFFKDGLVLLADHGFGWNDAYAVLFGLYDPGGGGVLAGEYQLPRQVLERAARFPVPMHVGGRAFVLETIESVGGS